LVLHPNARLKTLYVTSPYWQQHCSFWQIVRSIKNRETHCQTLKRVSAQCATASLPDLVVFIRDFGSTFEHLELHLWMEHADEIDPHLFTHTPNLITLTLRIYYFNNFRLTNLLTNLHAPNLEHLILYISFSARSHILPRYTAFFQTLNRFQHLNVLTFIYEGPMALGTAESQLRAVLPLSGLNEELLGKVEVTCMCWGRCKVNGTNKYTHSVGGVNFRCRCDSLFCTCAERLAARSEANAMEDDSYPEKGTWLHKRFECPGRLPGED